MYDKFTDIKVQNIKQNNNRYNDKLIDLSLNTISKNFYQYCIFLTKNIINNNFNYRILINNDNIFYTGLLLIIISIIINILFN